jgi:toxin-antitoxin system, toxin component, bro family
MKNELQIFKSDEFGQVRTVLISNEPYFVGKDVTEILGYERTTKAVVDHVDEEDRQMIDGTTQSQIGIELGQRGGWVINESGLYSLILSSKLPTAKKFKRWVTAEVLPAIRKTGSYTAKPKSDADIQQKRADAMERNSRVRMANLFIKLADRTKIADYREVCNAKAAEVLAGYEILPLPTAERRTYSAKEIGEMFGISANKVGKLANQHKLKTAEYGKLFYSKSEHSVKEVETWRYYDSVIPVFEKIFGREAA